MEFHASWDYRIAIDLFLGGVGIGIFLLSAYFSFVKKEKSLLLTRIGFILAPVLVGLGVLALMTELGKPFKMLITFINVNPTSVTSWGGFLQTIFILLSFAIFVIVIKYKQKAFEMSLFKGLVIVGSAFALAVGIYHGALLMSIGRPGWENGLIPIMFLVSSIISGSSLLMLIELFIVKGLTKGSLGSNESAATTETSGVSYSKLLVSLVAVQVALVVIWRISINTAGMDAIIAYQNLIAHYGTFWWIVAVGLGLLVPLILAGYHALKNLKMNVSAAMIFTVVVLVGSYAFKHIILYSGQIPLAGL